MSDTTSLDQILDQSVSQPAAAPEQSNPIVEAPSQPEPIETGDKPDAGPPSASTETDDRPLVPRKALEDERRKRQDLEKRIEELSRQTTAQPQPQQQSPQQEQPRPQRRQRPDPWTDPEGAAEHDRQEFFGAIFETRVIMSEELIRSAKTDYDEMKEIFIAEARQQPALEQQLKSHPLPAKFAYETGKRLKLMREIGDDPEAYRARVEEEVRAKLAPQTPEQPTVQAPRGSAPKSLAATPSAQPRDQRGRYQGSASLEDLLGG